MVSVTADLSELSKNSFWVVLDNRSLCHPYDCAGRRRDFDAIPKSIAKMEDDPFRSLAAELRRAGGFAKDPTPSASFNGRISSAIASNRKSFARISRRRSLKPSPWQKDATPNTCPAGVALTR
jgi:hypothetical protein